VQRVTWNLRTDGAVKIRKAKSEGNPEGAIQVPPGTYTARLTVGKTILSTPIEVKPDPRLGLTPADLEAQKAFVGDLQAQVTRLSNIVNQIQSVRDQLKVKVAALKPNEKAADWVKEAEGVIARCDAIEAKLHNPKAEVEYDILAKGAMLYSRITTLLMYTLSGSGAPTQGQREVFDIQRAELDKLDAEWRALLNEQVMETARKADTFAPGGIAVPGR
jgi:hypothetical protein